MLGLWSLKPFHDPSVRRPDKHGQMPLVRTTCPLKNWVICLRCKQSLLVKSVSLRMLPSDKTYANRTSQRDSWWKPPGGRLTDEIALPISEDGHLCSCSLVLIWGNCNPPCNLLHELASAWFVTPLLWGWATSQGLCCHSYPQPSSPTSEGSCWCWTVGEFLQDSWVSSSSSPALTQMSNQNSVGQPRFTTSK